MLLWVWVNAATMMAFLALAARELRGLRWRVSWFVLALAGVGMVPGVNTLVLVGLTVGLVLGRYDEFQRRKVRP